eukprot:766605-Hanusia_phi.AAC.7
MLRARERGGRERKGREGGRREGKEGERRERNDAGWFAGLLHVVCHDHIVCAAQRACECVHHRGELVIMKTPLHFSAFASSFPPLFFLLLFSTISPLFSPSLILLSLPSSSSPSMICAQLRRSHDRSKPKMITRTLDMEKVRKTCDASPEAPAVSPHLQAMAMERCPPSRLRVL